MGWLENALALKNQTQRLSAQLGAEFVTPFMNGNPSAGEQRLKAAGAAYASAHPGTLNARLGQIANTVDRYIPKAPVFAQVPLAGLSGLYDIAAQKFNLPESPGYFKDLQADVSAAGEKANKLLRTDAPRDAADVTARMVGGMLLPGPKLPPLAKTASIPTKVGRVATELVVPGRQGGARTAAAAAGIGVAATEGIDAYSEHKHGEGIPGYNSIANIVTDQQIQPHPKIDYLDYIHGDDKVLYDIAKESGDEDTVAELEIAAKEQADEANAEAYKLPEPDWKDPVIKAGILALGAVAVATRSAVKAKTLAQVASDPVSLMGEVRKQTSLGKVDQLVTDAVQYDQPLRKINEKTAKSMAELDIHNAHLDQVSAPSFNGRIHHAVSTGEFGHDVRVEAPINIANDYASFDPAKQQVIAEGLLAKRAFDEYKRNGVAVAFKDLGNVVPDDPSTFSLIKYKEELTNRIRALDADTDASAFATRFRKQFDGMLELDVKSGVSNAKRARDLKLQRPEYVPIRKNEAKNLGDRLRGDISNAPPEAVTLNQKKAATTEGAGVQLGEAANPVHLIFDEWTKRLHNADVNKTRLDILDRAVSSGLYDDMIKKVPPNSKAKDTVSVFRDGVEEFYHIKDPEVLKAFQLNPFTTRWALSAAFSSHRKLMQWSITGPGSIANGYFAPKAAAMDSFWGAILRPKGTQSGVVNEVINKLKKPGATGTPFTNAMQEVLSRIDPIGGDNAIGILTRVPIGTVRGMLDDVVEHFAKHIDDSYRNDGYLKDLLGEDQLKALNIRTKQAAFETTKSRMYQTGAQGSSMFGGSQPSKLSPGVVDVAPEFAADIAQANAKNAMKSGAGAIEQLLANSQSVALRAYANPLARTIGNILHSFNTNLHESARYMHFAANEGKVLGKKVEQGFKRTYINNEDAAAVIASQTRRLAGDVGQVGASRLAQELNDAVQYANVAVQSMAQGGRMLIRQPATTIFNMISVGTSVAGAYLAGLYLDPEHRAKVASMTPEQRVAYVPLPMGLGFNIPQEYRPVIATVLAHLDEITGMNDLDENAMPKFNEDFGKGVLAWLDGGLSEENKFEQEEMMKTALMSMNPYALSNVPGYNVGLASEGIDPQKTALTGEASNIKTQQVSGQDPEMELVGDMWSAKTQKLISSLVGSTVVGWARPAMDAARALDKNITPEEVEKVITSRVKDNFFRNQTNLAGQLWGQDYDKALPKGTLESSLYYKKVEGIKAIEKLSPDIRNPQTTGLNPKTALPSMMDVPPELQGTAAAAIFYKTHYMQSQVRPMTNHIAQLNKQMEQIDNQYTTSIEDRNRQKNEILGERQVYQLRIMNIMKMYENMIRKDIQDPTFTFQDADMKKYSQMPLPPPMPIQ